MRIGSIPVGDGAPLALIAGLNVIESSDATLASAETLGKIAERHGIPLIFKASFDKANRSSIESFRGPGLEEGLRVLARVKAECGLPVLTDVHEPHQAAPAADVVDCLQIPAFLCRQTDLVQACVETGKAINFKKGQFVAPDDMVHAVRKAESMGSRDILVTERGASFGYRDLVVDPRALVRMREFAPICLDATHACQFPGAGGGKSGGDRSLVAPLARAGAAVGIDALFLEVHPDPDQAPCDPKVQIRAEDLDALLGPVRAIDAALRG